VIASNVQNPPERLYLERLARELGVEVQLRDNVTDVDLVELYNLARAVVYAPVQEPFGLVPLEAMACGTPVVAVAEGGVRESVIHDQTGVLVERDPVRFAVAVRRVVDDPAFAAQLGAAGRAHALEHWSWDRAVATFEQYLQVAAGRGGSAEQPVTALAR
jgi:glycosyltransferase involved in cell wall biosynthesis